MMKKTKKYFWIIILIFGVLTRIIGLSYMPNALNCDEASAGYEAYSILNYGIDRNNNRLPIFLKSWGSGQNSLLTYMIIPLIKIFGLKVISIRLPMCILGCFSLFAMYRLLLKIYNKKMALIGLAFLAICPWHIMKSRWGLESNLFPDLILIFTYMFISGIENKNKILYYGSFVIAGIAGYAYGTAYLFLPLFIIPILLRQIIKKEINFKQAILQLTIVVIISLPIILFVIINTFNLKQINLPFMTIPKLEVNRYKEITSIFSGKFFSNIFSNFLTSIVIIITQTDGLLWNSIWPSGLIYIFSIIFTLIGFISSVKNKTKSKYSYIFNIWFTASIALTFICEPNINRLNILIMPIVYYTIVGIYHFIYFNKKEMYQKLLIVILSVVYIFSYGKFLNDYLLQQYDEYSSFESGLEDVVKNLKEYKEKEIHVTDSITEPYIYFLFYSQYNTKDFIETVEYEDEETEFRTVKGFGNYIFEEIEEIEKNTSKVFVIKEEDLKKYSIGNEEFNFKQIGKYLIINYKEKR